MKTIRNSGSERLCDAISFRVSPAQRAFLERIAKENKVGLCEAGRLVIDKVMANEGAAKC